MAIMEPYIGVDRFYRRVFLITLNMLDFPLFRLQNVFREFLAAIRALH
jgi:hypothetical protein